MNLFIFTKFKKLQEIKREKHLEMILIFPKYLYLIIYHPVILVTSKKILDSKFFIFEIEDIKNYFDCLK